MTGRQAGSQTPLNNSDNSDNRVGVREKELCGTGAWRLLACVVASFSLKLFRSSFNGEGGGSGSGNMSLQQPEGTLLPQVTMEAAPRSG